eukprot:5572541-Amphidinium_carterae.1
MSSGQLSDPYNAGELCLANPTHLRLSGPVCNHSRTYLAEAAVMMLQEKACRKVNLDGAQMASSWKAREWFVVKDADVMMSEELQHIDQLSWEPLMRFTIQSTYLLSCSCKESPLKLR